MNEEMTMILGIETSCDDTAAAVVVDGVDVRSSVVASQTELHAPYGGVVPEIASRAHLDALGLCIDKALADAGVDLDDIDVVAATQGPGLIGALLVGVSAAKALAVASEVPYVGINHLEAHIYAAYLESPEIEFPFVELLVSGGHTMLIEVHGHGEYHLLGSTIDDAAGEAFDKVARYLGLGHPGGPVIEQAGLSGNSNAIAFPRATLGESYDFSFSGLKTAVITHVRDNPGVSTEDVAASFQMAVVDVLVDKAHRAAVERGAKSICIGGGVAANSLLRERILDVCIAEDIQCYLPSRSMCTDNAAMVASLAYWRFQSDGPTPLDAGAYPDMRFPN